MVFRKETLSAALKIALRNMSRRKWRTLLAFIALTATVAGFVATVSISEAVGYEITAQYTERTLSSGVEAGYPYFCDILITPNHLWWQFSRGPTLLVDEGLLTNVMIVPGVDWADPYVGDIQIVFSKATLSNTLSKKEWYVEGSNGSSFSWTSDLWLAGADLRLEEKRLERQALIIEGKGFNETTGGVMVGYEFAKAHDIHAGDTIIIPTDNFGGVHECPGKGFVKDQSFPGLWVLFWRMIENPWEEDFSLTLQKELELKVDGIFWTSTPYDQFMVMDYKKLQDAIGFGEKLTCIFTKLKPEAEVNKVLKSLWSTEGIDVFIPTVRKRYVKGSEVQAAYAFSGISPTKFTELSNWQTVIISEISTGIFIASIFYAAVYERRWEIGLLKAIGFKPSFIMLSLLNEAAILGLLAGLTGFSVTCVLTTVSPSLSAVVPQIQMKLTLGWGTIAVIISTFTSLLSSLLPAYMASRITPLEAMRKL